MNKQEAEELILECMEVLYYCDARSLNEFELAIITAEKVEVYAKGPIHMKANWEISQFVSSYE